MVDPESSNSTPFVSHTKHYPASGLMRECAVTGSLTRRARYMGCVSSHHCLLHGFMCGFVGTNHQMLLFTPREAVKWVNHRQRAANLCSSRAQASKECVLVISRLGLLEHIYATLCHMRDTNLCFFLLYQYRIYIN